MLDEHKKNCFRNSSSSSSSSNNNNNNNILIYQKQTASCRSKKYWHQFTTRIYKLLGATV